MSSLSIKGKQSTVVCFAVSLMAAFIMVARRVGAFGNQPRVRAMTSGSRGGQVGQTTRHTEPLENQRQEESDSTRTTDKCKSNPSRIPRRETLADEMISSGGSIVMKPIGVVRSVYRLCVGTPRQGLLAPHARARIELNGISDGAAAVDGLGQFSHVWIVFVFHLNTVGKRQQSKIAPPALGGAKVGVLATRSPHRFNPIGMTLAKLDNIRTIEQTVEGQKKTVCTTVLDISGADLVDGTPVVDIKPYVPNYDGPLDATTCQVPDWVSDGLSTAREVRLTESAEHELRSILHSDRMTLEFYGGMNESIDEAYVAVTACIREVLSMDVRSQYQTLKARKGQSQAERAQRMQPLTGASVRRVDDDDVTRRPMCTQQLDNLLVYFSVQETGDAERGASAGSGAEDVVTVHSIHLLSTR